MANVNKVMLIGRLTRDPEPILNGKGAKFGFAVNNRKLNQDTQQWEEVPVFIDMEIWNRGEMGKQADRLLQTVRKGQQLFIEGHLKMDTWTDKNDNSKRSKLAVVVENFQYLDPRADGGDGSTMTRAPRQAAQPARAGAPASRNVGGYDEIPDEPTAGASSNRGGGGGSEDEIPF